MTCGQLFLLFCDDSGFCHDEAHFSRRIDDKILEAALTLAQPKKYNPTLIRTPIWLELMACSIQEHDGNKNFQQG